jgi:hypothetical protein
MAHANPSPMLQSAPITAPKGLVSGRERNKMLHRLNSVKIRLDILLSREDARYGFHSVQEYRAEIRRLSEVQAQLEAQL